VTIEPGALPVADGQEIFDLGPTREFTVPLSVAERSVSCRIDPLFSGGILIPGSFVKDLPLIGGSKPATVNTRSGALDVQEMRLALGLRLGNFGLPNPIVQVSKRATSALVGGQLLMGFSITYDVTNGRARLQRPKAPLGRN